MHSALISSSWLVKERYSAEEAVPIWRAIAPQRQRAGSVGGEPLLRYGATAAEAFLDGCATGLLVAAPLMRPARP